MSTHTHTHQTGLFGLPATLDMPMFTWQDTVTPSRTKNANECATKFCKDFNELPLGSEELAYFEDGDRETEGSQYTLDHSR